MNVLQCLWRIDKTEIRKSSFFSYPLNIQ